jgi:putative peptide zinc metalloprotease protein
MFLCSVSTVIFNGNPLLRYDGYFVLSDWLEIPNLQQQALGTIRRGLARWFCGIRDHSNSVPFSRTLLLTSYGIMSTVYRVALAFLILWTLHSWLKPYGLGVFVQFMAVSSICLLSIGPLRTVIRFFRSAQNREQIDWSRFQVRTTLAGIGLVLLLIIPIPCRVAAGALLDRDTALPVYATLGGTLETGVPLGSIVDSGQILARLEDPRVQSELIRLQGEYEQHRVRLEQLERRRIREPGVAAMIPAVREAMRDYKAQADQLRQTVDRLVLRAPCAGVVLPSIWQSGSAVAGSLPTWTGSPLDGRNRGCFIKPGTTICLVGPVESRAAIVLVNQNDINLVRVGQQVRTVWRELAGEVLTGQVTEIAALDLDSLPRDAVQRLKLPARSTAHGVITPVGTWYQVRVRLDSTDSPLLRSAAGDAKILVEPQSILARVVRWFKRTFAV